MKMSNKKKKNNAMYTLLIILVIIIMVVVVITIVFSARYFVFPVESKNVAMVGYFAPIVPQLIKRAESLGVLEKQENRMVNSDSALVTLNSPQELGTYDTVIVTATTLINNTLHEILESCREAYVVIMGASAPLSPSLFRSQYPQVKNISGRLTVDIESTLSAVSQGRGDTALIEKLNIESRTLDWGKASALHFDGNLRLLKTKQPLGSFDRENLYLIRNITGEIYILSIPIRITT